MARTIVTRARPHQPVPIGAQSGSTDSYALARLLGMYSDTVTRPINADTVLGLPAANFATSRIANGVAAMLVGADAIAPDGVTVINPRPTILARPTALYPAIRFWGEVVRSLVISGNFYGLLADPDQLGWHRQCIPLPNDSINCRYGANGYLLYEFAGEELSPDEIVHVAANTIPGSPVGRGVVELMRYELGAQLDQQSYARSTYRTGAVPSGIVQLDTAYPTEAQVSSVKDAWTERHGGGQRSVAVLGKAMSFTPLSWSPEDLQFLAARQFSVAELAFAFNMRPSDLDASVGGSGLTYANRQDNAIEFLTHTLAPVMALIEAEWSDLLPGSSTVRGNPEALLRSTTRERYELHALAQQTGIETVSETRAIEGKADLDTIPDNSDPGETEEVAP